MAFDLHAFFADRVGAQQLLVALGLHLGKRLAGAHLLHLRLHRQHTRFTAFEGGLLGAQPVIQIHRVHLAQQLPLAHGVARLNLHPIDSTCKCGPNLVGKAGLNRANAKQGGLEPVALYRGHRDVNRGQRPGAQGHIAQQACQHQEHADECQRFAVKR